MSDKAASPVPSASLPVGPPSPPAYTTHIGEACLSCGETDEQCPDSQRSCGHHCNCALIHAECHWCDKTWDGESDCAFCNIVTRTAPATIVREWDDAIAIVPLNPVVPGHLLVLPRRHVETFFSDPDTSAAVMRRTSEMVHGVDRHVDPFDYNVITSAGGAATQTVFHLHVHLVPRVRGDGLRLPWTPDNTD